MGDIVLMRQLTFAPGLQLGYIVVVVDLFLMRLTYAVGLQLGYIVIMVDLANIRQLT